MYIDLLHRGAANRDNENLLPSPMTANFRAGCQLEFDSCFAVCQSGAMICDVLLLARGGRSASQAAAVSRYSNRCIALAFGICPE